MADLARMVDDLSALSVIEAAQLSRCSKKMGSLGCGTGRSGGVWRRCCRGAGGAAEQTEFDVILAAIGEKKINVIKGGPGDYQPRAQGSEGPSSRPRRSL